MRKSKKFEAWRTVIPGVTIREGKRITRVRFYCMVNGKRFNEMCDQPAAVLVDARGNATKALKELFSTWVAKKREENGAAFHGLREPTVRELVATWEEIARKRNADPEYGRPRLRSIETALKNVRYCIEASGVDENRPYTELTDPDTLRRTFKALRSVGNVSSKHGTKPVSGIAAKSYVASVQTLTAKWTILEYRDRGFVVRPTVLPDFGKSTVTPPYRRLTPEQVEKINVWYAALRENSTREAALAATLIYNLAIRPIDCGMLTKENFPAEGEHHRLNYLPTKTKDSSGRFVDIEIPDALYEEIKELSGERWERGETLLKCWRQTFLNVNVSMRVMCDMPAAEWSKASYELRKLCLDTVMRQQGIDQAVKLSGDRRETLEHYYVDPYKGTVPLMRVAPAAR